MASESPLEKMQSFCNPADRKALGRFGFCDAVAMTTLTAIDRRKKRHKAVEQALRTDLKSWFSEYAEHEIVGAAKKGLSTVELRYDAGKRGMISINSELLYKCVDDDYIELLDGGAKCIRPEQTNVAEVDMVFLIKTSWRDHCKAVLDELLVEQAKRKKQQECADGVLDRALVEQKRRKKQRLDDTSAANTLLDVSRNDDL